MAHGVGDDVQAPLASKSNRVVCVRGSWMLELREQRGMTVIVATHDAVIASRCDRIIRLLDGRLVEDSLPRPQM
jgi:predicted ABC-type transport system involved in lysophospholipase L1 biosynthesis ATPase subunit